MSLRPLVLLVLACAAGCATTELSGLPELPPGRMFSVGGDAIFVRQSGTGPDVVLLHGLGDSSVGWRHLERPLAAAGYRVTVWDALGAGRSAKPPDGDYSIAGHVGRLEAVLDQLGIAEAALVGHSLGGSIALRFAAMRPRRTKALFVIDPAAYREGALDGRWFWELPFVAEIVLGAISNEMIVDYGLKQNFHDLTGIDEELTRLYLREARRDGAIPALIAQQRQLVPVDADAWERGHGKITAPTCILWGEHDELVPVAQGRRLVAEIRGAELIVFPDLAHSPQLEDPYRVLRHLAGFLDEHVRARPRRERPEEGE